MRLTCLHCGQPEHVEVFEVWADGSFMLDTCCEGMHEAVSEFLAEDPAAAARWMGGEVGIGLDDGARGLEALMGGRLRRVVADCGHLYLDWNLELVKLPQREVFRFIDQHHRHCDAPAGWKFGVGVRNGSQIVAVASVGRPVARQIDHTRVVEVNRVCVRTDVPAGQVWNACSLLYGWAARQAQAKGFERVITYTLEHEDGTSLKAAGYVPDRAVRAESWDRGARRRTGGLAIAKTRWVRELKPARRRQPLALAA